MGMEDYARAWARAQRQGNRGTSAKDVMRMLGFVCLLVSACFWYPIEWELTGPGKLTEAVIAISFGTFLVFGPPVFTSFLVPWSPGAMLLQKINGRTWGQLVVIICSLILGFYAARVLWSWWGSREMVHATDMIYWQVLIGLIATILTPALIWAPTSSEEMAEYLRQDQLVRRYELQAQADMAYLQGMVLDAQRAATYGLATVVAEQGGPNVAAQMKFVLASLDQTINEIAYTVGQASKTAQHFPNLQDQQEVIKVLDYVESTLQRVTDNGVLSLDTPAHAPTAPVAHQEAQSGNNETVKSPATSAREVAPVASGSPRQPQVAGGAGAAGERLEIAVDAFGMRPFKRSDLERALNVRETVAGDCIRLWRESELLVKLTEAGMKDQYRFTAQALVAGRKAGAA